MQAIALNFPITDHEYEQLDKQFGNLTHWQAWQLKRRNANNNVTDEQDDIVQDLRMALLRAGSYYKRQTFIQAGIEALRRHVADPFVLRIVAQLTNLWTLRTHHGAGKQKFGDHQEAVLDQLLERYVPDEVRPRKDRSLSIDKEFSKYCKMITWNELRQKGKKITREKSWRTGLVSISEFDYLGGS